MRLLDSLVKLTTATTSATPRMKPLVGFKKIAPAKSARRADDRLDALQLAVPEEADDPYNSGRFKRVR